MAVWTQLSVGMLLDYVVVRLGFWTYRPMPFTLLRHSDRSASGVGAGLGLFSDVALLETAPFLARPALRDSVSAGVDGGHGGVRCGGGGPDAVSGPRGCALVAGGRGLSAGIVQGITLGVYHTGLFPSPRPFWRRWACCARSVLYVVSIASVFYILLPQVVLTLTHSEHVRPLLDLRHPLLLCSPWRRCRSRWEPGPFSLLRIRASARRSPSIRPGGSS